MALDLSFLSTMESHFLSGIAFNEEDDWDLALEVKAAAEPARREEAKIAVFMVIELV